MNLEQRLNRNSPAYSGIFPMTQIARTPQGSWIYGDFRDSLDPRLEEQVYKEVDESNLSSYEKRQVKQALPTKKEVARKLLDYTLSDEGSYVMGKYNLTLDDILPGAAYMDDNIAAATIPELYPSPVVKNINDRGNFKSMAKQVAPYLSKKDVDSLWIRHELRHLYQDKKFIEDAKHSPELAMLVEVENAGGLLEEYVSEMSAQDNYSDKKSIGGKAMVTLNHYIQMCAAYAASMGKKFDAQKALAETMTDIRDSVSPEDYAILSGKDSQYS